MRFKALAVDIDGTITDGRKRIQPMGIETLREVEDNGIPVMLTTGNVLPVAYGLATFIGLSGPVVAENGGIVCHDKEIHVLGDQTESLRAYDHLRQSMDVQRLFTDNWRMSEVALLPTVDPSLVAKELSDFDVRVEATGFAIHIIRPGHSKMSGLRKAASLLEIDPSEIVAIGDSDNDASMLSGCGMGVAVANASPAAKAAAGMVTDGKHSEGVREALTRLGLI